MEIAICLPGFVGEAPQTRRARFLPVHSTSDLGGLCPEFGYQLQGHKNAEVVRRIRFASVSQVQYL
jgi:hypothetical protein